MSEPPSLFEEAIEALTFSREGTISEAANIPDDRWDYRPHPEAKSVDGLVRHMVRTAEMLVGEAADPEGDFSRRPPDEHFRAHAGELPDVSDAFAMGAFAYHSLARPDAVCGLSIALQE